MPNFLALTEVQPDETPNPFAARRGDGTWGEGTTSIAFLQENFGHFDTLEECKAATNSEGLKRYFDWLDVQGFFT